MGAAESSRDGHGESPESGAAAGPNQTEDLVALALGRARPFHDQHERPFLAPRGGEGLLVRVDSTQGRRWLQALYRREHGKVPNPHATKAALEALEGEAIIAGPEETVHVRVAAHEGVIYLDLGDPSGRAVEITTDGWSIVARAPAHFRRAATTRPLPVPVVGGHIDELRPFVNPAGEEDFRLMVALLLMGLNPSGPYPIGVLEGEQGAAKSTTARVLKCLVDDAKPLLRSLPRSEQDLAIHAANAHVLGFDNLGGLRTWMSDAFCRLSTGGGLGTRTLYSDDEEQVFDFTRLLILNGIESVATRQDAIDRSVIIYQPKIEEGDRLPEIPFWQRFEEARPRLLGALLTAASVALRDAGSVKIERLPRMADFAIWVSAGEKAFGWPAGAFMSAYTENRAGALISSLDGSPLVGAIESLLGACIRDDSEYAEWDGTPTDLYEQLSWRKGAKQVNWPRSAQAMSRSLTLLAPALRAEGIEIDLRGHAGRGNAKHRLISLRRYVGPPPGTETTTGDDGAAGDA